jgi:thiol-disulfide isomerase/thioredoxin
VNGTEKIFVPNATEVLDDSAKRRSLTLEFPHYDSVVELRYDKYGIGTGTWSKRTADGSLVSLDLTVQAADYRFETKFKLVTNFVIYPPIHGRWSVKYASDEELAVGVFKLGERKSIEGTFLTTTGDYRYLAGSYQCGLLRLSCFDGSHAFLFSAKMQSDGTLKGDFWSGAKWHDTWTAKRDDKAALPDGFTLAKINPKARLKDLKFRDLDGKERSLSEPGLLGKATIIDIFGSWCPNCHDAAPTLAKLETKYGPSGLKVLGLAFEMTGDPKRDAKQVRRYIEKYGTRYPILLAGDRDRKKASASLPVIEEIKGYPTFLFVDGDGVVQSVYTGFSGPATGDEHAKLEARFDAVVRSLLDR